MKLRNPAKAKTLVGIEWEHLSGVWGRRDAKKAAVLASEPLLPSSFKSMHLQTISSLHKSAGRLARREWGGMQYCFSPIQNHSYDFCIINLLKVCCCISDQCKNEHYFDLKWEQSLTELNANLILCFPTCFCSHKLFSVSISASLIDLFCAFLAIPTCPKFHPSS